MGIDKSTLNKSELGQRSFSMFHIIDVSAALGVTSDFLLRGLLIARIDEELALRLAVKHPELVSPQHQSISGGQEAKPVTALRPDAAELELLKELRKLPAEDRRTVLRIVRGLASGRE